MYSFQAWAGLRRLGFPLYSVPRLELPLAGQKLLSWVTNNNASLSVKTEMGLKITYRDWENG